MRRERGVLLSVVIPAYNEERLIGPTIEAVHERIPKGLAYEIIVVDNGSTDQTCEIAHRAGALVLPDVEGTIGAIRNEGAERAQGEIIVFIDADVVLQPEWSRHVGAALQVLEQEPLTVLGSVCDVPADATWIERFWFNPNYCKRFSHVGTGHMIVTRKLFKALGGFDGSLPTGEDYEFSRRASQELGARVLMDERLRVEHRGNPKSLWAFLVREIWHGGSDFVSWNAFRRSKVAMAAMAFLALHITLIGSLIGGWGPGSVGSAGGVAVICGASSIWKYRGAPLRVKLLNAALYYVYYWGRAISAVHRPNASRTRRTSDGSVPGPLAG